MLCEICEEREATVKLNAGRGKRACPWCESAYAAHNQAAHKLKVERRIKRRMEEIEKALKEQRDAED